jgi:peptidoglycan hydrolase-like protein with peptidoglycan-binding domain
MANNLYNNVANNFEKYRGVDEFRIALATRANGQEVTESTLRGQQAVIDNLEERLGNLYRQKGATPPEVNASLWAHQHFFEDPTLRRGDQGQRVTQLQEALNNAGIRVNGEPLPTTGNFLDGTKAAVEQYQRQNNLQVTGEANKETQVALGIHPGLRFVQEQQPTQQQPTQQPQPQTPPATPAPNTPTTNEQPSAQVPPQPPQPSPQPSTPPANTPSTNEQPTAQAPTTPQQPSTQPTTPPANTPSTNEQPTAQAPTTPQQPSTQPTTPPANTPSSNEQPTAQEPTTPQQPSTQPTTPPSNEQPTAPTAPQPAPTMAATMQQEGILMQGAQGPDVAAMQRQLAALGYTGADGKPLAATGNFDANTTNAVKAFEKDAGIAQNGIVGPTTMASINQAQTAMETVTRDPLYAQAQEALKKLPEGTFANEREMNNMAGALVRDARMAYQPPAEMTSIAEVRLNTRGDGLIALEKGGDDAMQRRTYVNMEDGKAMSLVDSGRSLQQEGLTAAGQRQQNGQQQENTAQRPEQQNTPVLTTLNTQEPENQPRMRMA